jgi:hypothetical protein
MVDRCVNPFCNQPSRHLGHGKLFVVEFPHRLIELRHHVAGRRERFWLCEECARTMTVAVRREFDGVSIRIINLAPNGATKLEFIPPVVNTAPPVTYSELAMVHSAF